MRGFFRCGAGWVDFTSHDRKYATVLTMVRCRPLSETFVICLRAVQVPLQTQRKAAKSKITKSPYPLLLLLYHTSKMSLGDFPVDGMAVAISRLNIDEFSGNTGYKIQWALYLRAQIVLQNRKPEDPFGYHGLAGIYCHLFDFIVFLTAVRHSWPASKDVAARDICTG